VAEMAEQLARSKAWVSMRLGLIAQMSPRVREKIFSGAFPVYPYMYTLRQFRRMNGVGPQDIEEFMVALSGKKLSVREIEQLAQGYFRGPPSFRQAIREGHPGRVLEALRRVPEDPDGCNEFERVLLKDLETTQKYMQRVMGKSQDRRSGCARTRSALERSCSSDCIRNATAGRSACMRSWSRKKASGSPTRP